MELPNKSDTGPNRPQKPAHMTPVVPGAVPVKRPATRRFFDYMFAESAKDVSKKVGSEVVMPRIKSGIEEAFRTFLHGVLWGGGSSIGPNIVAGTVLRGGNNVYHNAGTTPSQVLAAQANVSRAAPSYQDLVYGTQSFAETVLANMIDTLNQYRVVTVADLYEISNVTPPQGSGATGWTNLDSARIMKNRDGYVLELPRPRMI